jgi:serine/threonine protein kinase
MIKGGKYIAQGTYGCVFGEPPLKCKEETSRQSNSIASKLMNYENAEKEFEESSNWSKIDNEQQFSLTATKICEVDENNIKPSNNISKCHLYYDYPRFLVLYRNGGKDLIKLKPLSENYEKIFSGFQNLFDGLVLAHSNGLFHTDIKPTNILTGEKEIKLRFIDFGLSFNINDIKKINSVYTHNTSFYSYWPFELGCFDEKGELKAESTIRKRFYLFNTRYSGDYTNFGLTKFQIPFETIYDIYKKTNFKDFKTTFEKVDVFSMGITLIDLLIIYFNHYAFQVPNGKNQLFYHNSYTNSYSRFETLKSKNWLSDKQLEYQEYLLKNVTQPLMDFINHCVDYNPNTRYTAKEAAEEYRKLLPNFKTHLKQNEIRKGLAGLKILNEVNDIPLIPTPVKEPTPKPKEPTPKPKEPTPKPPNSAKSINSLTVSPNEHTATLPPKPASPPKPAPLPKRKSRTRKIKNTSIIPKTKEELNKIYDETSYYIKEDDLLVKIARALGSRKNFEGRTRVAVYNDIAQKAKSKGISFK